MFDGPFRRSSHRALIGFLATMGVGLACEAEPPAELQPDELLRSELGLTSSDVVHRVRLEGRDGERADPGTVTVARGAYVEFVTADWLIHEVLFLRDSVGAEQWAFLESTDQVSSPPLLNRDSRYLLSFDGAPAGRYPYVLEGNVGPGYGVILVTEQAP